MAWHEKIRLLDQYFPYFLLIYGIFLLVVLEIPFFQRAAAMNPHPVFQGLKSRRTLAWISLFFGALWCLQNLWLYK